MKKVFEINGRMFWSCNGQMIWNVHSTEWRNNSRWLRLMDGRRIRIEVVKPPPGRCPHCGKKT